MSLRHWNINNYHSYDPTTDPNYIDHVHDDSLSNSLSKKGQDDDDDEKTMMEADHPQFMTED